MHEHVLPAAAAKAAQKAIDKLLEMLEDSDPGVRLQAAALLLGKRLWARHVSLGICAGSPTSAALRAERAPRVGLGCRAR